MNTLLVFTVLFAGACMADVSHIVAHESAGAKILESAQDALPDGSYQWGFKTENGIAAHAEGSPSGAARGEYHYIDSNGQPVDVIWTADENGFNAQGSGIPVPPEHVARTLAYNAAHPYKEPTVV